MPDIRVLNELQIKQDGIITTYKLGTVNGYYNPADGKFYEDSSHVTEIEGLPNLVYTDIGGNALYIYKTSTSSFVKVSSGGEADVNIQFGYLNEIDGKFYEEPTYTTEIIPSDDKIYIDKATNIIYRWDNSFISIGSNLSLGETENTAYRGDRGKTAYDHASDADKIPAATASGFYKVGATAEGHVSDLTAVTKADITALGIPDADDLGTAAAKDSTSTITSGSTDLIEGGAVYTALADKVDKVTGKDLSANDFTDALKDKLDGIEQNAEVNVQADWSETDTTNDAYIANKPTLGTAAAKDSTDRVSPNNTALVESQSVYSAINTALSSIYTPRGDITCAELTPELLISDNVGNIYEVSDSGVTTASFLQGAGVPISAGSNVGIISAGQGRILFNLMANAFDLTSYQKIDLSQAVEGETTVEGALGALSENKQDSLTFDNVPTENSANVVKSGGVYTALQGKANSADLGTASAKDFTTSVTSGSKDLITSGAVYSYVDSMITQALSAGY